MEEALTYAGVLHDGAEVALAVNWDRVLIIAGAAIVALQKLMPIIWPWIEPYIMPPIAAFADSLAKYRKS